MRRQLLTAALATAVVTAAVGGLSGGSPAVAQPSNAGVVSETPVGFTPNVENGTVYALALVGRTVVVGGDFTQVADATERVRYRRAHLFGYDLWTGAVTDFAPDLDGPVSSLVTGPGNTVYVGGTFQTVNGVRQHGVTQLDVGTGERVPAFRATVNQGDVRALAYSGGRLYVGGDFSGIDGRARTALARLDAATGALDDGFDLSLAAPDVGGPKVDGLAISPDGRRLVAIGAIQRAAGIPRAQLIMVNTEDGALTDWYTAFYAGGCYPGFDTYLRAVDFSPAGDYFVVVSTGRWASADRPCDTAARFTTAGDGEHAPVWVNHTGGNSLYAVAVTGSAVYVGGHELWLDNPFGHKNAGPGAVFRPGIGAIDPESGRALGWNPTRTRGVGVEAFLATPAGLIVGSDTAQLGHRYHARLGMFPPA